MVYPQVNSEDILTLRTSRIHSAFLKECPRPKSLWKQLNLILYFQRVDLSLFPLFVLQANVIFLPLSTNRIWLPVLPTSSAFHLPLKYAATSRKPFLFFPMKKPSWPELQSAGSWCTEIRTLHGNSQAWQDHFRYYWSLAEASDLLRSIRQ